MKVLIAFFTISRISMVICFNLTILHTNDVHSRFEETNKYSGQCTDPNGTTCYGGMARIFSKVQELRSLYPNTLFLDAGDQYQGTLWFNEHGGTIVHTFMNLLGYDVMALGNHEFDNGVSGLLPLLDNANFSILSSNINTSREPTVQNKISKHVVLSVSGERIGVIGYTTKNTPYISNPGNLLFLDEISSIRQEVNILKADGVNKIIAVGHAGYTVDKKIAEEIDDLDIVVGGHTNTFLYSGTEPSNEKAVDLYPTVVNKTNGDKVLVVQDYAFGKYLGCLHVVFDDSGKLLSYGGNPILLDGTVPKDETIDNITKEFGVEVVAMMNNVIGRALVHLNGHRDTCRKEECNMGNLIADGLVHQNLLHADNIDGTKVFISIVNSGSIRSSIEPGNITVGHAISTQPFRNTIETIRLRGDYLLQALERSVDEYDPVVPGGQFLQYSGIRVKYDLSKPPSQRVVEAMAICQDCSIPKYEPIDKNVKYKIILSNFILGGGDKYTMIKEHAEQTHTVGDLDSDVFIEYVRNMSPIYNGLEGRITFVTTVDQCQTSTGYSVIHSNMNFLLFLLFSVHLH